MSLVLSSLGERFVGADNFKMTRTGRTCKTTSINEVGRSECITDSLLIIIDEG